MSPEASAFVDHRDVDWTRVARTRYTCFQRFLYRYPGPVRHLRQKLVVVPNDRYADQRLCDYDLAVSPYPAAHRQTTDAFGNRIINLEVDWIDGQVAFEVRLSVERTTGAAETLAISRADAAPYLRPTTLTAADGRITAVAGELAKEATDAHELAARISDWVAGALTYGSGATGVHTTAAQALAKGRGLCQDYAHIMLALCRAAGLPARYVSGHMPGEGGSHAWVEALLPDGDGGLLPTGFDPTNRRRPHLGYATVAVGRDYSDVPPTSGSFTAPYGGALSFTKKAGLTLIEFVD